MASRILIVDDQQIMLTSSAITVRELGYEVFLALTGNEALELCRTEDFDIILMDITMPNMDGFECSDLIRKLKVEVEHKQVIIGFTGIATPDIREKCLEAGLDDYINKLCTPAELATLLKKWTATN